MQKFYQTGSTSGKEYSFVIIDISVDDRLRSELTKTRQGQALFEKIVTYMPALVVSQSYLTDLTAVNSVEVIKISDPSTDIERIKGIMLIRLTPKTTSCSIGVERSKPHACRRLPPRRRSAIPRIAT